MPDLVSLIFFLALIGGLVMLACGATVFAAETAPRGRQGRMHSGHLVAGAWVAAAGLTMMALVAWSTHEDVHYDDSLFPYLAAVVGATTFVLGLGPFVPWLLGVLGRGGARLPAALRLSARHLADRRARTAPAVAATMIATAFAVAVATMAAAGTAQSRAQYVPQARPGALVVRLDTARPAPGIAAVRQELPGTDVAQGLTPVHPFDLTVSTADSATSSSRAYIGDQALLRYLTGDPSFPYDESRAVAVTSEQGRHDTVTIEYSAPEDPPGEPRISRTVPATVVPPPVGGVEAVFLPAKLVLGMGVKLELEALIVDPSLHRVTAADRDRVQERLGESGQAYLEEGFVPSYGWLLFPGAAVPAALAGALAATVRSRRPDRLLLRAGGSPAAARGLTACRAALAAACGAVPGAVAGCVAGLLLAWPFTTSVDWDPVPRVPFETPWSSIALATVALPVLAAAVALLFRPGRRP
ncbi:hypothetical protein ACFYUV_30155 [Nonomuraea sp. NPDC003560]|uniref:hypothetical protein n=1 Tax=Nonomuraea sp. NPDC003560 TaxID=3364341 RepID=UPI003692A649